uniref:Monocarboxylate transporter 14 n=1 Tax=Hirondellea gigas TaxID=1518452 RepID=A0A6A7FZE8_9CRUS
MTNPNEEDENKSEEGGERSKNRKMSENSGCSDTNEKSTASAMSSAEFPSGAEAAKSTAESQVPTGNVDDDTSQDPPRTIPEDETVSSKTISDTKDASETMLKNDPSRSPVLEDKTKMLRQNSKDEETPIRLEGGTIDASETKQGHDTENDKCVDTNKDTVKNKDHERSSVRTGMEAKRSSSFDSYNVTKLPTIKESSAKSTSTNVEKVSENCSQSENSAKLQKRRSGEGDKRRSVEGDKRMSVEGDKRRSGEGGDKTPDDTSHIFNDKAQDKVESRLNGNAKGLEKPKRIFQKPPEEYLPMLEEQPGDEDYLGCEPEPLDGGWGWMVVFASFMIHVIADGFTYTLGIFYVYLLNYFSVSKAAAAWMVSILVGVTLGSGPISGALVNKFGCRLVTIGGAILASFMLFISIYATTIAHLYITIGIGAGLGFGMIYLPAIVCVSVYFEKKRSFAIGIAVCGSGLGTFVYSPMVEFLINTYNWKGALIVISGLVLNCVFFGALFRPLEDNFPRQRRPQSTAQHSVEKYFPDTVQNNKVPRIQMSGGDQDLRQNFSEMSLATRILGRRRGSRTLVTGSIAAEDLDIQRIKSHGHLNPTLASLKQSDVMRMTVSQPLVFPKPEDGRSPSPSKWAGSQSGLLHRKDIFYRGSLLNIPEYKRNPSCYRESVRRTDEDEDYMESKDKGCGRCSKETRETLRSLTDFGLLTDPIFQLFALSNFLTSIGFYAPYIFIVDRALDLGIESARTVTLLSVLGISNTISRVVLGYVSDLRWINRLYVYNIALTICGLGTCASIWMVSFESQMLYAAIFGSTSGAYVGLTSVVLVDLLGMERLTNAFGLLLLAQGMASVIGPPICGSLYEMSQNYNYTFLLAGSMIAISGVMLFVIPFMESYKMRQKNIEEDHRNASAEKPQHV